MKKMKLLIASILISVLFTSCLFYDGYYESRPTNREIIQSSIYAEKASTTTRTNSNTEETHHFEDSSVIVDMAIVPNKITITIENISGEPILLDIKNATVLTKRGNISKIVTYNQTKTSEEYLSPLNVVVNPSTTYKEEYVAEDSLNYNTFGTNRYLIDDWTNKYNCQLVIPYKVVKTDGSGKSGTISVF